MTTLDEHKPARPPTPGAGVDPRKVVRPSKRLRNWHRAYNAATDHAGPPTSLKAFARRLATSAVTTSAIGLNIVDRSPASALARRWLASKGVRAEVANG